MLEHHLAFFISAVGVFNGIMTWIYLQFFYRPRNTVLTLGCMILMMFCIRVGVSCVYFFTPSLSPYFIQLGLSANFMIGPLMLAFVTRHLGTQDATAAMGHVWVNALVITVFGFVYRFEDHFFIWDHRIRYVIHSQLTGYLVWSAYRLRHVINNVIYRPEALKTNEMETLAVYMLSVLICLGFVVSLYTNYIIGPVFTSIVFYGLALGAVAGRSRIQAILHAASRYRHKKVEEQTAVALTQSLEQLMEEEALYKTPNLKIDDLAERMQVGVNLLSQLINDNLGMNYASFINTYRIREAKQLLSSDTYTHLTVEAIGYEVGFNSKSTFYAPSKNTRA